MKKLVMISMCFLLTGSLLSAQTLDDVLKEHFAAIGQDKLIKTNTIRVTGKLVQAGLEIPFIQMAARPAGIRVEATLQGLTLIQTYDGKEGWNINPFAGITEPQPMGEDEMKQMKYQADLDGMLWSWKDKGYTVTLEGQEEVEGTNCFKIKIVTPEGDTFTNYLDAESYIPVRTNAKVKVQGNESEADTYFSNYMMVEGIAIAGQSVTKIGGQIANTIVTDKVELNVDLDKSLFGKPEKK
ncbi:MAG: hypothetical protein V2A67_00985 [Bacteroidota bacterium]